MKIAAIDVESDLAHSRIWCCSVVDVASKKIVGTATTPQQLWAMLNGYDTLVAHNGLGFDYGIIEDVWDVSLSPWAKLDTLVMGRLWMADIKGGHSLKAWGERIGQPKMDFEVEDFDAGLTEDMVTYCEQDTVVLAHLYDYLTHQLEADGFSPESIKLEHDVFAITHKQIQNGFLLDCDKTTLLWRNARRRQQQIDQELQKVFPPIVTERWSEKTGKRLKDNVEVFNVGSRQQIAKRLKGVGCVFTKFTEKGNIIVDEPALKRNDHSPEAQLCLEYLTQGKRAAMLDGWLRAVGDDDRVHGYVNTCGAVTRRMTHSKPNVAQADSASDMRSCWTVPAGKVLLGVDASGLELRMLAYRIGNPDFTKAVVEGDVHWDNVLTLGWAEGNRFAANGDEIAENEYIRDQAKTFIYAFLYGAGDAKMGSIAGSNAAVGKRMKQKFMDATPGLQELRDSLKGQSLTTAIDGGKIRIRSEHSALNTLLQGDGAVLMKQALVNWTDPAEGIDYKLVANVHDEWQVEVWPDDADKLGRLIIEGIEKAGEQLCPGVPFTGKAKVGKTWAETH